MSIRELLDSNDQILPQYIPSDHPTTGLPVSCAYVSVDELNYVEDYTLSSGSVYGCYFDVDQLPAFNGQTTYASENVVVNATITLSGMNYVVPNVRTNYLTMPPAFYASVKLAFGNPATTIIAESASQIVPFYLYEIVSGGQTGQCGATFTTQLTYALSDVVGEVNYMYVACEFITPPLGDEDNTQAWDGGDYTVSTDGASGVISLTYQLI